MPPLLETPHSQLGEDARFATGQHDNQFGTQSSIPSPSRDGNDLSKHIKAQRVPEFQSSRSRIPFSSRNNAAAKPEFTPMLKSATKNRAQQVNPSAFKSIPENLETPIGLRASYNGLSSPAMPFHSSFIGEDFSRSIGAGGLDGTPIPMPATSSSTVSSPAAGMIGRADGLLENGRAVATLRDQEARLEAIDKENFGLKLKIHYLENALRKSGKEFNEAALKENTDLKVDKVTLQRDLKHYSKCLAQAERNLEEYRAQLVEYAEKVKQRHASEELQAELEELRLLVGEKDVVITSLTEELQSLGDQDANLERMQDDIQDLQAEIREKERLLDSKDEEIQSLRASSTTDEASAKHLEELEQQLAERDGLVRSLEDALQSADREEKRLIGQKDRELEDKDDELKDLEEQLKVYEAEALDVGASQAASQAKDREITELKASLEQQSSSHQIALTALRAEMDKQRQSSVDKEHASDENVKDLKDTVADLEAHIRNLDNQIEDSKDINENLEQGIASLRHQLSLTQLESFHKPSSEAQADFIATKDLRIRELEANQDQQIKELQSLRSASNAAYDESRDLLRKAQSRVAILESSNEDEQARRIEAEQGLSKMEADLKLLRQELENNRISTAAQREEFEAQKKALEARSSLAEDQIESFQRTIQHMQDTEGNISSRETQLQQAFNSERSQLSRKVASLEGEISAARREVDEAGKAHRQVQDELSLARDRLGESEDLCTALQNRIDLLEDKVQASQTEPRHELQRLETGLARSEEMLSTQRDQISDLEMELRQARDECDDLKDEVDVLLESRKSELSSDSRDNGASAERQRAILDDLKVSEASVERLKAELTDAKADMDNLDARIVELEEQRGQSQHECHELRNQVRKVKADSDRALQDAISEHEKNLDSLHQDLSDSQTKLAEASRVIAHTERRTLRLQSTIDNLERDLRTARVSKTERDTVLEERKDLHDMLKTAKLDNEDLLAQRRQLERQVESYIKRESDLRLQVKLAQSNRTEDDHAQTEGTVYLQRSEARHAAELKGLVKQIEYLGARCRREERFRCELSFVKDYFIKQVEMHGKCNKADMRLVRAMGIPTDKVMTEKAFEQSLKAGLVERRRGGLRPTFRVVAIAVLASVRMKAFAAQWHLVRKDHQSLLRKLECMRKEGSDSRKQSRSASESKLGKLNGSRRKPSSRRVLEEITNA